MTQMEFEACPFCPESSPTLVEDDGIVHVECMKCHARGPEAVVEDKDVDAAMWGALTYWNMREDT